MPDLTKGLRVHYDCEGLTDLIASTTFPDNPDVETLTEKNNAGEVTGKFGNARGQLDGLRATGIGFFKIPAANGPFDWRNGTQSFSFSFWVDLNGRASAQMLLEFGDPAVNNTKCISIRMVHQFGGGNTGPVAFLWDGELNAFNTNVAFNIAGGQEINNYVFIGVSLDVATQTLSMFYGSPADGKIYGTADTSENNNDAGALTSFTALDEVVVGMSSIQAGSTGLLGDIDHFDVWDEAKTQEEWEFLYNEGAGREATIASYGGNGEDGLLNTQELDEDGLVPVYDSPLSEGNKFINDGRTVLHIINDAASSRTVTIEPLVPLTRKPGFGILSKDDAATTIATSSDEFLGPFPFAAFGPKPLITYDNAASLRIAVLRI